MTRWYFPERMGEEHSSPSPAALKWIHQQGVTGVDDAWPYFDGTSTDPKDHFIDLNTDSMETVRGRPSQGRSGTPKGLAEFEATFQSL